MGDRVIGRDEAAALDAVDPLAPWRERFVTPDGIVYLDGNSLGMAPRVTLDRVADVAGREWADGLIRSWDHWLDLPRRVGDRLAPVVGAPAGSIVVHDSTTVNLYQLVHAALGLAGESWMGGTGGGGAIAVDADDTLRSVDADALPSIVGQYAKVRLVAGSLVVAESLQTAPLVGPGAAVLAIQVPDGALPIGLRERSRVELVVPANDPATPPAVVPGRVVGLPSAPASVTGMLSLSVEVARQDAAAVVATDDVRVVLVEPGSDPAYAADGGS